MAINQKLKFSWGHIIAFLALIFISYVTFMGITYYCDGNFLLAGIGVILVDLILALFFIIPQQLKGTEMKFGKKVVFERLFIFLTPIIFVVAMMPYAHFWTVFDNRVEVEQTFRESIGSTKKMFSAYEEYAKARIDNYTKKLSTATVQVKKRKAIAVNPMSKTNPTRFANSTEALALQLNSSNFTSLRDAAEKWIDQTRGVTIWNVFLIGNIDKIEAAMKSWNKSLTEMSAHKMQNEDEEVLSFTSNDPSVVTALDNFKSIHSIYTTMGYPTPLAIGIAILLYLMLIFPYVLQRRNTKSTYMLFGQKKLTAVHVDLGHEMEDSADGKPQRKKDSKNEDNIYGAF